MADEQVRLDFSVTEEDVLQYFLYYRLKRSPARFLVNGGYPLWVGALTLWACFSCLRDGDSTATLVVSVVLCGAMGALGYRLLYPCVRMLLWRQTRYFIRQFRDSVGERTFQFSADRVSWKWKTGESTLSWAAFQCIDVTPAYVYLYFGSGSAFIVPKRAFPSSEAVEAFLRVAREWHAEAIVQYC